MQRPNPNLKQLYATTKRAALRRELPFNISLEDFAKLVSGDCYLCGSAPSSLYVHDYTVPSYRNNVLVYNGVDRFDSAVGYTLTNVAPCCKHCNYAKNNMDIEDFLEHIKKVYAHNFLRGVASDE